MVVVVFPELIWSFRAMGVWGCYFVSKGREVRLPGSHATSETPKLHARAAELNKSFESHASGRVSVTRHRQRACSPFYASIVRVGKRPGSIITTASHPAAEDGDSHGRHRHLVHAAWQDMRCWECLRALAHGNITTSSDPASLHFC